MDKHTGELIPAEKIFARLDELVERGAKIIFMERQSREDWDDSHDDIGVKVVTRHEFFYVIFQINHT